MSDLSKIPLLAQALVACRLSRRAVLAMLAETDQQLALGVCDVDESMTKIAGKTIDRDSSEVVLSKIHRTRSNQAALQSLHWALEAVVAAHGPSVLSGDEPATVAAMRCIESVSDDPRISALQIAIVVESDIDLLAFACDEDGIQLSDSLSDRVFKRLPPCHALTLGEPRRNPEDDYR